MHVGKDSGGDLFQALRVDRKELQHGGALLFGVAVVPAAPGRLRLLPGNKRGVLPSCPLSQLATGPASGDCCSEPVRVDRRGRAGAEKPAVR